MKKLMFAAVAVAAGSLMAVESGTVGYQNLGVANADEFVLSGVQFKDTSGEDATVDKFIKASLSTPCYNRELGEELPGWKDKAPQIQLPNIGGGFDAYYYVTDGWDETDYTSSTDPVWVDGWGSKVNLTAKAGVGMWLKSPKLNSDGEKAVVGCSYTVCGAVPGAETVRRTGTEFVTAAMTAPVDIAIDDQKITWVGLKSVPCYNRELGEEIPGWKDNAPQVQVRNIGGGFDAYYYVTDGWDETDYTSPTEPVWVDGWGSKVSVTITAGSGIWFKIPHPDGEFGFDLADVTK